MPKDMRKRMKAFSLSILLGVFAVIATSTVDRAHSAEEPMSKPNYEIIEMKTEIGIENSAAYFDGKSDQVAIFVPGAVFNKESWFFLAERLQQLNVASLSLDGKTLYDVLSAIKVLKDKGFKNITLVGGSMGGAAILDALKEKTDESINKVIVLAPSGGSPIKSGKIKKLFVVAKGDRLGMYPDVKKLYEGSSEPKKIVEFEGSEHAQHLFKSSNKDELSRLIIDFITH
jgi:pimeloyl-ACP methyl ester carboxylesterase